jgi:hypothetical protein
MRFRLIKSRVQYDAEIALRTICDGRSCYLNSDLQKDAHTQQRLGELKDSPGVGYPTLGRPWVAQGPRLLPVCMFGRQGSQGKQR